MAPTKPLVEQQIRACHDVMGIPPSDTGALVMQHSVVALCCSIIVLLQLVFVSLASVDSASLC
jgi:hypothetical protein